MLKFILIAIWQFICAVLAMLWAVVWIGLGPVCRLLGRVVHFKEGETRKRIIVIASLLVIGGSLLSFCPRVVRIQPKINFAPFVGIGEVVAEETVRLLQGRGQVVIWTLDTSRTKNPFIEKMVASFQETLRQRSRISLLGQETIPFDPASPMIVRGLDVDQFHRLLHKHLSVDAVVSFAGMPPLTAEQIQELPEPRPKIIVGYDPVMSPAGPRRLLIKQDVVQVTIEPCLAPLTTPAKATTPREWFDRSFRVVTATNASTLPSSP
ncbi:MAG: hypothetical protein WCS70_00115 [Verrucomicrobiota bacterium]